MTDEQILAAIKENPDKGFSFLIKEFKQQVYWRVRKIVYSHDDANDVTQNTFIKVYRSIDKFQGNSKLYTWIYRIATNEAITFIKKKSKENNASFEDYSYQMASNLEADVFFNGDEAALTLQKIIAQLPEKQRIVFNMKYFEEKKYEEISEELGTSVGALKASYHHAVKKIQEKIMIAH